MIAVFHYKRMEVFEYTIVEISTVEIQINYQFKISSKVFHTVIII